MTYIAWPLSGICLNACVQCVTGPARSLVIALVQASFKPHLYNLTVYSKYITATELTNAACCTECSYIAVCIANFITSMVSNIAIDEVWSSTTSIATFCLNVAVCCSWWHRTHRMIYSTYNNNVSCDNYMTMYMDWILQEATEIQLHPGNFILCCTLQLVNNLLKCSIQPVIDSPGQVQQPLDSSH